MLNNLFKHGLSVIKKLFSFFSNSFVIENLWIGSIWILASNLPRLEEGVPINIRKKRFEIVMGKNFCSKESRLMNLYLVPVNLHFPLSSFT
jgi:hypothetical protein